MNNSSDSNSIGFDDEVRSILSSKTTPCRIAVFCGASESVDPAHLETAHELGRLLGQGGNTVIYGAGGIGLMGALASGSVSAGACLIGVIPAFLLERERNHSRPPQQTFVTADLFERKRTMMHLSDAYVVLPGGYGTLDELAEVLAAAALGVERKPIIVLDPDNLFGGFVSLLERLQTEGYCGIEHRRLMEVVDNPESVVHCLAHWLDDIKQHSLNHGYNEKKAAIQQ